MGSGKIYRSHNEKGRLRGCYSLRPVSYTHLDVYKRQDPDNVMNPGGTLGLDLEEDQKRFLRDDIK